MSAGPATLNAYISIMDGVSSLRQDIREARAQILSESGKKTISKDLNRLDAMRGMLEQDENWLREMVEQHSPGGRDG